MSRVYAINMTYDCWCCHWASGWGLPGFSTESYFCFLPYFAWGFPGGSVVKNLPANVGDTRDAGFIPGLGRSSAEGNGNPFQYSCLEIFMDRRAWRATVHGVHEGLTWLSPHTSPFERKSEEPTLKGWGAILHLLEEEGYLHKLYEISAWTIYFFSSMYVFIWPCKRLCLPLFWFWPQYIWQLFLLL